MSRLLALLVVLGCSEDVPPPSSIPEPVRTAPPADAAPPPADAAPPPADANLFAAPRTLAVSPAWKPFRRDVVIQVYTSATLRTSRETFRREWYAVLDRVSRTPSIKLDYRDVSRTAGTERVAEPYAKTLHQLDIKTLRSQASPELQPMLERDARADLLERPVLAALYVDRTWRGGESVVLDDAARGVLERELGRLAPDLQVARATLGLVRDTLGKQATFRVELELAHRGTRLPLGGELIVDLENGRALELDLAGPSASLRVRWIFAEVPAR